ncbi:MAG TPA: polysaccharide biosynthesis/export family protein, partial [Rhizomicrobium sp.]
MTVIGRPVGKLIFLILVAGLFSPRAYAQSAAPNLLQQLQQVQGQQGTNPGIDQGISQQTTVLVPLSPTNPQLPTSRLEQILSARAGVKLKQFGYDQLGVGRPVSISQMGAVQDDYVLGPGDEIVVSLRGQENAEYRVTVDRDARVVLPRMNPISVGGRSFGDFRRDLVAAIHRSYIATEGFISVGRVRQVSVLVSGEVNSPGVRTLTGLSTPADAILVSGGIKKTGSMRNVYILRGSRRIAVDLYSVLTGHGVASHVSLGDGDRIVVPPLGPTVAVAGWVRRPGIYEISGGRSSLNARDLLSLAGGLEVRGKYHLSVLRVAPDGRNRMSSLENESGAIGDSDILFVQPAADQTVNSATLSGGTALAGKFSITNTKLSQILKSPGALGGDPYTLLGIISRRDPVALLRTLIAFTPVAVLKGSQDMDVQGDDIVRVISAKEARLMFATIRRYEDLRQTSEEALRSPWLQSVQQQAYGQANATQQNSSSSQQTQYGGQQAPGAASTAGTPGDQNSNPAATRYFTPVLSPDMATRQALLQAEDDQFSPGMVQSRLPNYQSSS